MRVLGDAGKRWLRLLVPLLYLLPLAYLVRPVFWTILDSRFYDYFHSKRSVSPWEQVVVVGIDRETRDELFDSPIYPISRHVDKHAQVVARLDEAGARAIVFDLDLGSDNFERPPHVLADAFRRSGKIVLVMSLQEEAGTPGVRGSTTLLSSRLPDSLLIAASQGVYVADVRIEPDGVVRRIGPDPRVRRLGLETIPEYLSGFVLQREVPIEFPSVEQPVPSVSYTELLSGDRRALTIIEGKIALVGLVAEPSLDFVSVPRLQSTGQGASVSTLPGVIVLAAMTETLIRGAPIREASGIAMHAWNLIWCVIAVSIVPTRRPALAALVLGIVTLAALVATGILHAKGDLVFPAGLLFGSLFLCGSHALVVSHTDAIRRLHAEEMENERVRGEMRAARRTQEGFLPEEVPTVQGFDIWGRNVSSETVSGDYYDVLDLGNSRPLVLAIADVSGKGLPASLLMSNVQAGLHSHMLQDRFDLETTAIHLNRLVCQNTETGSFVTLFLAELDKETRRLRYICAGHDHPLLLSSDGNLRWLEEGGLFLGFDPDSHYGIGDAQLNGGDVLVLYTDGLTEARDREDREFGTANLLEVVKSHRQSAAAEIGEVLLKEAERFSGLSRQADDVTLIVLKVC